MNGHSALCPVRVGREKEIVALAAAADHTTLTFISGPAGIGKSRLCAEALHLANDRGMLNLTGHCSPEQSVAYAPFVVALRRRLRPLDDDALRELFAGPAQLATALVPDIARRLALVTDPPTQDELFTAVWHLLSRLAGSTGSIFLLEDLHWADTDSLRLLSYLAREGDDLPMWIVGTYRNDELHRRHPLAATLVDLARERRYVEIALAPLSRRELAQMVSAIFDGAHVGEEFIDALLARTDGNPFFVEELLKVLLERGDLFRDAGDWTRRELTEIEMPLTVRESLLARVRTLSPAAVDLIQLAALDGDRLDVPVLTHATGLSSSEVDDVLREGLRLQLLREHRDGAVDSYSFRHALTREALHEDAVGPDRRRGHLQLARAIAAVHADQLDQFAASLADHYFEGGDTAAALLHARRAAQQAAASRASDEAGRRYEQTLSLMTPDDSDRVATLLEAVAATIEAPDPRLGVAFAEEARRLAHERGDRMGEARALNSLGLADNQRGRTPQGVELLQQALVLAAGHDDEFEAVLRASLTRQLTRSDRVEEAMALLPDALMFAERLGNHRALSSLHVTSMMNSSFGPAFDASLAAATQAARDAHDDRAEFGVAQTAGYICIWCGDFRNARASLQRALQLKEHAAPFEEYTQAGYAWLQSLTGEYDAGVANAASPRRNASVPTRIVALTALCEVAERRGDAETGALVDELWDMSASTGESQRSVPALAARARQSRSAGDLVVTAELFWDVLDKTTSARGRGSHWMFSPDFAVFLRDHEQTTELRRWSNAIAVVTANDAHVHNRAAAALVEGLACTCEGQFTAARTALTRAEELFAAMPCPAREIDTLLAVAELERRAGRDDQSRHAAERAVTRSEYLAATPLLARARAALTAASAPTVLASILFTDIVRSTEHLSDVGDRQWRQLLERHDHIVRRELNAYDGREINTTGDGFVAAFSAPTHALRCALALRDALQPLGVVVRSGVHIGECQEMGDDLTGIAVHVAARVCAAATPNEVWTTATVRALVAGSGINFLDRGTHVLKGLPDEWPLAAAER